MKSFLSQLSIQLNLCDACPKVAPRTSAGYKVFTFKNPYLGNTCVPFLHWACSLECANEVEIPARAEQILSAQAQDRAYEQYVIKAVNQLRPCQRSLTSVSLSSLEDSNTHASAGEDGGSLKCQSEAGNSNSNSNCVIL